MKTTLLAFATTLTLAAFSFSTGAFAGDSEECDCPDKKDKISEINIEQVKKSKKKLVFVDANGESTRVKEGVIPGALLLTSYRDFDVKKELPKDKEANLVFYCANTRCSASDLAATTAKKSGFKNVSVLKAGIMGWKKAGLKAASFSPAKS